MHLEAEQFKIGSICIPKISLFLLWFQCRDNCEQTENKMNQNISLDDLSFLTC